MSPGTTQGHLQTIFNSMTTGVVVLDENLVVQHMNTAAEDLLQTSHGHTVGAPLAEAIVGSDALFERMRTAIDHVQPFTEREIELHLPDHQRVVVDLTSNILDHTQSAPGLLIELQPLNRLRRINQDEESVDRQETARQLIRGLAHEIKNPLGGIRGAAQLLERELHDEGQREYTGIIIGEADRLKTLVDRMLGPQRVATPKPVNLLQVCERVITLLEAEHPEQMGWIRDYDPSLPELHADEAQLIQAILNVTRNACEALVNTPDPKITFKTRILRQFTIGATRHRQAVQLDISDNGPGVDPQLMNRIFFPMISGRPDGSGLGLAITQNIIAQHEGTILVNSRPGLTCFSIVLPFCLSNEMNKQQPKNGNSQGTTFVGSK